MEMRFTGQYIQFSSMYDMLTDLAKTVLMGTIINILKYTIEILIPLYLEEEDSILLILHYSIVIKGLQ